MENCEGGAPPLLGRGPVTVQDSGVCPAGGAPRGRADPGEQGPFPS